MITLFLVILVTTVMVLAHFLHRNIPTTKMRRQREDCLVTGADHWKHFKWFDLLS